LGVSAKHTANVKFDEVYPEDPKYYKVYELKEGASNNGEISPFSLSKCKTKNLKYMMDTILVVIPVHGDLLNKGVGDTEFKIVVTEDGRKGVEMKSPVCYMRQFEDVETVGYDGDKTFSDRDGRVTRLTSSSGNKLEHEPKGGYLRYTLFIFPEDMERCPEPEDEESGDESTFHILTKTSFNHIKNRRPKNEDLVHDLSIYDGTDFEFEGFKFKHVTVYLSVQLAVHGTKVKEGGYVPKGNISINGGAYMLGKSDAIRAKTEAK
jgi:hypothetical protein